MSASDPTTTQPDLRVGLTAELAAVGFFDAEEIGRGGFGVVYRCTEQSLDRAVAIKVLTSDLTGEDRQRFVREQHALGRLSGHPNIVEILQADITATGCPYIVMPFHSRGSLESRLRSKGPIPWDEVLSIGERIAGALAAAHAARTIHRDVKPANILVTDYDEPQLADFGIARISGGFETATGRITATPAFTAPEVLDGEPPDPASDIYSLGATLFCLVTGHAAFERRTNESVMAQFRRVMTEPIPDLRGAEIPAEAAAAVEASMARDPRARPESAAAYQRQLRDVLGRCAPATVPPRQSGPPAPLQCVPSRASAVCQTTPPPTALTKFRPPTPPRARVERPRLLRILREGKQRRLTVVHAPAGFGKSTLAAQWANALAADQIQVAWLTIDADDNNAVWFLAHLVEAVRRARPSLGAELGQILEERATDATRYVVTALINEIHSSGDIFAIVIDDWHRVTNRAARATMEFLLDNACHHLRIIVASRSTGGLPLSRMRVCDELVEIDSDDLRFNEAETNSFLVDVNRLDLAASDIAGLQESTEGWAAALQLASLSLRGKDNPAECIGRLSGHNYAIGEYVESNILDTLDPALLDFLLSTSVTETVCGDLADVLAGVGYGQEMLEEAEHLELFIRRLDHDSTWFRFHRLFADLLRHRLARQNPDRLRRLHQTASNWFADHKMLNEAVDHALAANDVTGAVGIVEERGRELLEQAKMATVLGLVAKLPSAYATTNPRVQLLVAWADVALQRALAARTALDLVDALLDSGVPDEAAAAMRVEASLIRTGAGNFTDNYGRLPDVVEGLLHANGGGEQLDPFFAMVAASTASTCALSRFDFDEARRWQHWVAPYRPQCKGPFAVVYGYCLAAIAAYEQLDIAAAESDLRTALALAQTIGTRTHGATLASALLGALQYHRGDLVGAEELLDDSAALGPEGALVEFMNATYGIGARVKALRGDGDAAEARLAEGAKIAANLSLPRLAARIVNECVRIGLPIDQDDRGEFIQPPFDLHQPEGLHTLTAELQQDTGIRLLLDEHSPAAAEQACTRAERLVREIATSYRPRAATSAELLWAASLSAAGRQGEAITLAVPALTRCAEHGLIRFATDEGWAMDRILAALDADPTLAPGLPQSFLREALAAPHFDRH